MERVKILLGAGQTEKKCGWTYVDIIPFPDVDVVHDLDVIPWPFPNSGASHISAIHLLEHLDSVPVFMEECWRILNPGGTLYIVVPNARDIDLAWSDPTHKRAFTKHTFINYMTLEGCEKFGYLKHAWTILDLKDDGRVIRVRMTPLPTEFYTDGLLERIQ
jgi:predicted SAM-dependent methyltransferase